MLADTLYLRVTVIIEKTTSAFLITLISSFAATRALEINKSFACGRLKAPTLQHFRNSPVGAH